jgi:hypothetical protein
MMSHVRYYNRKIESLETRNAMTKVQLISNESDITSDFIGKHLKENDLQFYRFNTEELNELSPFWNPFLQIASFTIGENKLNLQSNYCS